MPADTDHIRRDALHAARSEVRILVSKWIRRLDAEAKAHIETALTTASDDDDGTELGRQAAQTAIANALKANEDSRAVDSTSTSAIAAAADA